MVKILIYRHRKSEGAVERKPGGQGVDFILAHGWDDLSGRLHKDTSFDLLILDSVPPKKKPDLIKRIMKILDIPVIFFEEKNAGRDPFCRKFKSCYSESPITYLRSLRIARKRYFRFARPAAA